MIKFYAVVLVLGVAGLLGWVIAHSFSLNLDRPAIDPEQRFGIPGRRTVAGMVGFGMAGMSAEYSPLGIAWPLALILALAGAAAAWWYTGWAARSIG